MRLNRFLTMLNENKDKDPPPFKLLDLAGELCRDLQSSSSSLEKLVGAMTGCKYKMYFLTNIHVVRAFVLVHIHNGQYDTACRVLVQCEAKEKEELVRLWHEIHYRRLMERLRKDFLTSVQKFRCRKRNPPPITICPEGFKNRNHPEEIRQYLYRFAVEVTAQPDKKQRDKLARDLNLKPLQVYNWFSNYRRRRKPCDPPTEMLYSSCREGAWTFHREEEQSTGSSTPQTAGGSHAGTDSEQMEKTLLPCEPRWEQSTADLDKPPRGTYLEMLESSFLQSTGLHGEGTSKALFSAPNTEQPVPFCTKAVQEPAPSFTLTELQPRAAVSSAGASPHLRSLALCKPFPVLDEHLAMRQSPCSTRGVSGSVSTPGIEAGIRVPLRRVPQGGCIEGSPGGIIQQSDLEAESFILREGQLGSLESIPHSSCQPVFGKPQRPPVSAPRMEESRAPGRSQVLEDPADDPLSRDVFRASCLLFGFSPKGQM